MGQKQQQPAQNDYLMIEKRAQAEGYLTLASFAKARYDSYVQYTDQTIKDWHLRDAEAVLPAAAARTYIDFEHDIANNREPIYCIVAMIPCDQLWPWLAKELQSDAGPNNLYSFWITGNNSWHGAHRLDNFIDLWFAEQPQVYDLNQALYIYRGCMIGELNFFKSACGQPLTPMPKPQ